VMVASLVGQTNRLLRVQKKAVPEAKTAKAISNIQSILNELVKYSMSASIFHHLCGIAILKQYKYVHTLSNQREFYFLRDNGLIQPKSEDFVDFNERIDGENLVEKAKATPIRWLC